MSSKGIPLNKSHLDRNMSGFLVDGNATESPPFSLSCYYPLTQHHTLSSSCLLSLLLQERGGVQVEENTFTYPHSLMPLRHTPYSQDGELMSGVVHVFDGPKNDVRNQIIFSHNSHPHLIK